jgi:hypothetical protein
MLKSLLLAVALLIVGAGFLFYIALRGRSMDVSDQAPFAALIGRELVLQRDMQLVRVPEPQRVEGSDELWEFERETGADQELIARLDRGTPITVQRARLIKGGTSGSTHALVFGTVRIDGEAHTFAVYWGEHHFLYQDRPYWTFPAPPWDMETPSDRYELPSI